MKHLLHSKRILLPVLMAFASLATTQALAQAAPRVAVTDLGYSKSVESYFAAGTATSQSSLNANRNSLSATSSGSMTYVAGTYSYMEQRELRSFTNDIRGALLKGTSLRVVQGKGFDAGEPQPSKAEQVLNQIQTGKMAKPVRQPDVNDIIARIRKGEFSGADYVLFGQLSHMEFRDQLSSLQGTSNATHQFALDLLADFSLIDTKTLEVKAAFSAQGAGVDTKLLSSRGDVMPPNRAKVMRETSQSLASDVYEQLVEQLEQDGSMARRIRNSRPSTAVGGGAPAPVPARQEVIILR